MLSPEDISDDEQDGSAIENEVSTKIRVETKTHKHRRTALMIINMGQT